MRPIFVLATLVAIGVLIFGCSGSDNTNNINGTGTGDRSTNVNSNPAATANLTDADRKFMAAAAQGGMAEVEQGRLAVGRASDPDVKQFGQRMIDDHSKAGEELKQLAVRKNITLPELINDEQKSMTDKLSKLTGTAFDKEYMKGMLDDHQQDVKEFQDQSSSASDGDLKARVTKTLPTLQDHLKMATNTNKKVNP
jgi:putative membrane protein